MKVKNLYKHKHPEFHKRLGFGILVEKVNDNNWSIRWLSNGRVVPMHPNWLEVVYDGG
tara:strand:+ start:559 stop:732 length:174 start_codon:yes stop_codon:yes gene_type:complete